jgi:2-iminobutanoate/2-iminopropanoate deaminase
LVLVLERAAALQNFARPALQISTHRQQLGEAFLSISLFRQVEIGRKPRVRIPTITTHNDRTGDNMNPHSRALRGMAAALPFALAACAVSGGKEVIGTTHAPAAIGPYSQAIKHSNVLYLAGQIPIDPRTNQLSSGSIEEQTRLVLDNLRAVLAANNMTMDDVVSTSVFMKDLNEFARMNQVYAEYFKNKPPARATVQVARLPRDVSIEISAIAAK